MIAEKRHKFCGQFCEKKWAKPSFVLGKKWAEFWKLRLWPKKVGFWPILKMDLARKNPLFMHTFSRFGQKPNYFL